MPEAIEKINVIVLADRELKLREMVESIDLSHGSVVSFFNYLFARWIPRLLTIDHDTQKNNSSRNGGYLWRRKKI